MRWTVPAFAAVLALAWGLWQAGQTGGFLFDDFPNLAGLEQLGAEPTLYGAWKYVAGGISSQLGRPLALASFALQYESWPDDPAAFVRVNIALHLFNGLLLYGWLHVWSRGAAGRFAGAPLVPFVVASLWLLTPLHAAAVLYVVQRMTLLAGTCVLAGLLLHTRGREAASQGRVRLGYVLMACGSAVGLGLGILAKESAALFPLLVLVFEATLLRHLPAPAGWRAWRGVTLVAPLLLIFTYLLWDARSIASGYDIRNFTPVERLFTEARVLFLYLWKLFVPSPYGVRLLYDDYPISQSLWSPWTTLPAVIGWLVLVGAAWRWRTRHPAFGFGVLWFVAAHLLESTVLPLEIAFEHRNYVAAIGPLLAAAVGAAALLRAPGRRSLRLVIPAGVALYAGLVMLCLWQATTFWGAPNERTYYWAMRQPESQRAMHDFAGLLFQHGRVAEAGQLYASAMQRWPEDPTIPFRAAIYGCVFADLPVPSYAELQRTLESAAVATPSLVATLDRFVSALEGGRCPRHAPADVQPVFAAALTAERLRGVRQNLYLLNSRVAELTGDRAAARQLLDEAIRAGANFAMLMQGVDWALRDGDLAAAKAYLALAPRLHWMHRWTHRLEIRGLHQLVALYEESLRAGTMDDAGSPAPR